MPILPAVLLRSGGSGRSRRAARALLLIVLLLTLLPPASLVAQTVPEPVGSAFAAEAVPAELRVSDGTYYKPGEVLVGFKQSVNAAAATLRALDATALAPLDLRGSEHFAAQDATFQVSREPLTGYVMTVPPGQEWSTIARLRQDPNVLFAQPNWVIVAEQAAHVEEPFLVNDTFYLNEQWYMQRIQASRAWPVASEYATAPERVRVAILDSGVDVGHPDLGGRVAPVKSYVNDVNGNLVTVDDFGHGTHIAGLIGATLNNGLGIAGTAPEVLLDPYKVLDSQGLGFISDAAAAIRQAADNGAAIINMSFAIPASVIDNPNNANLDFVLHSAIYYARDRDVLLVAAAGNDYPSPVSFPAAYPEVMAIAATDYRNQRSDYSAIGSEIDLAAPGGTLILPMLSTWPVGLRCFATLPVADYCYKAGTSFATGMVSGVAALLLTIDPTLSADELWDLLVQSAAPTDNDVNEVGAGLLDAAAAVRAVVPPVATIASDPLSLSVMPGAPTQRETLVITNDSSEPATWLLTLPDDATWLAFTGRPATVRTLTGTVSYAQPAEVSLTFAPGTLPVGLYTAELTLVSNPGSNAQTSTFPVPLAVSNPTMRLYLPIAAANGTPAALPTGGETRWAVANSAGQTALDLSGNQSLEISLPFSFPLGGRTYTNARVHSDGFLSFPSTDASAAAPSSCLPTAVLPDQAVFGWWADLEPGAAGARVSTFRTDDGRHVVEFTDVPLAAGATLGVATFQIVLDSTGNITLNYRSLPSVIRATVGVEALDGRLYNLAYCANSNLRYGLPPAAGESLTFTPEEIY